jgi:hypothetical protein
VIDPLATSPLQVDIDPRGPGREATMTAASPARPPPGDPLHELAHDLCKSLARTALIVDRLEHHPDPGVRTVHLLVIDSLESATEVCGDVLTRTSPAALGTSSTSVPHSLNGHSGISHGRRDDIARRGPACQAPTRVLNRRG